MDNCISILPEILLLVMMTSAFVITFLTVLKIVKQTGLFHGKTAFVASLLISASAIAGYAQLLIMPNNIAEVEHTRNITVNYSLLPALTLTGVIVMLQLFIIAATTRPDEINTIALKESARPATKRKSPGRPKKKEPGRSPTAQKSGGKGKSEAKASTIAEGSTTT
jgi:hypothetical protein